LAIPLEGKNKCVADGAILPLLTLLSHPNDDVRTYASSSLMTLTIAQTAKVATIKADGMPSIYHIICIHHSKLPLLTIGVQRLLACTKDTCADVISNAMHALAAVAEHPESKRVHDAILVSPSTIATLRALIVTYSASSNPTTAQTVTDTKLAATIESKDSSSSTTSTAAPAPSTAAALSATSHQLWRASPLVVRAVQCALDVILSAPY
jgi:hypothetical protein